MRKLHLLQQADFVATGDAPGGRDPLTYAVHRKDGGLFKRRAKERACCVGKVMFAEHNLFFWNAQLRFNCAAHPKLVNHPGDHRFAEGFPRLRIGLQDSHQNAVKFAKRLFEEDEGVRVRAADSSSFQTEPDGLAREAGVVYDARTALFLGSSHQLTLTKQSSCRIAVVKIGRASCREREWS